MIPIFNKKRIQYSIILMMLMLSFKTYSQCTGNTSLYPSGTVTPVCNGTTQTITTAGYASEYSLISVTSGTTYTFTSNTGDYLTIANASGGAPVYAFGTTPVVWTATFTGTIRMYNNSSGPGTCGTSTSPLRTRTVKCGTPPAAPSNDNCSGATAFPAIPTNGTCSSLSNQSTANATASGVTPSGACTSNSGSPDDDVWFSFVATTTSVILSATYVSGSTDVYWQVFSGSCASTMTALLCTDTDAGGTITGLTIGQTYYIKMYTYSSSVTSVQTICLSAPYDPCSSITNIAACGSTVNVSIPSGTGGYASSACYTAPGKEMIYTFTPATTGLYYIQQFSSFTYIDYEYKAASGGCSSSGWTCIDDISGAGTSISGITLTAGVQYYIALDPENTAGGNVSFSIVCPPPDPCSSITNIAACGSTVSATIPAGNGNYASSACYTAPGREMIYSFTPSTTGLYYIQQFSYINCRSSVLYCTGS
ncbi:MAG: hypothetical protein HY062_01300 [Bacteroidetes bacterium]|nr:hypothetical protein [Bacteroidota bacterium]